jgi:soluble lytic murein transglycosylase-like protein
LNDPNLFTLFILYVFSFTSLGSSLLRKAAVVMLAWPLLVAAQTPEPEPRWSGGRAGVATPEPSAAAVAMATLSPAQLCQVARKGDAEAMNQLAWAYSHGQGVERSDAYAAYLFFAASSAGHEGAKRMLNSVSWPPAEVPPCLDEAPPSIYAPTGPPVAVEAPPHIEKLVKKLAPKYQLDPKLVTAVMSVESNFNAFALSPKNAMGLMQLMPDTAKRFGVRKPFDAQDNMQGGMAYLRWLLAYFEGDLVLVAAGYNAGEGAVEKHKGVPPFAETQVYVWRVLERVGTAQHPFNAKVTTPSSALKLINKTASR